MPRWPGAALLGDERLLPGRLMEVVADASSQHLLEGRRQAVEVLAGVLLGHAVQRAPRELRKVVLQRDPAEDAALEQARR